MVVIVDQSLCSGCGICIETCPEVFATTADGKAQVIKQESTTCNLEEVADLCPTEAIEIE